MKFQTNSTRSECFFGRQLRGGELIRRTFAGALLLLSSTPAFAEVCDKAVGDSWIPSHGPVWLLNPVGFPFGLTLILAGLLLVGLLQVRWLGYLAAAILLLNVAATAFWDLLPEHEVYLMQLREGCRSYQTDLMDIVLMTILAFAYVWLGHRNRPIPLTTNG